MLGLILTFYSCDETDDTDPNPDCPALEFTQDGKVLTADFEGIENLDVYEWFVDDQLVETENSQNQRDNKLNLESYNPGTYKVCIKAETEDCPEGTEFCKEIVIEEGNNQSCPDLKYERDGDYLIADFDGIDTLEFYAWRVTGEPLGNETIIENEGTDNQGDNKFSLKNLQPGVYDICLISEGPNCTNAEPYCREIKIEDGNTNDSCPDLSFIVEGQMLFANFAGIDQLQVYKWFVDGQLVETEDLQNQDRDDLLDLSSYNPGTYKVCIKAETNDCPNGVEFCVDVEIPTPQPVDCSVFDIIYFATSNAEFVGAKVISIGVDPNTVVWSIDGNQVTPTSATGHILILQDHLTQVGKYEVCYKAESQSCGTLEKCIEIDFKAI